MSVDGARSSRTVPWYIQIGAHYTSERVEVPVESPLRGPRLKRRPTLEQVYDLGYWLVFLIEVFIPGAHGVIMPSPWHDHGFNAACPYDLTE